MLIPPDISGEEICVQHNTKTNVVVPVVRIVPVAIGATHVVTIVVERATTQEASHEPIPTMTAPAGAMIVLCLGDFLPATE